jgi:glyoxylate reductase
MIVVTTRIHPDARAALEAVDTIRQWDRTDRPIPADVLSQWLETADALFCTLNEQIGHDTVKNARRLKIVANMAVGYDNLDLAALSARGIMATNTPDVLTEATAELTWALMLALMRGLVSARDALLAGAWTHWRADGFLGTELYGKRLGIVGLGRIGRAVARRADAFGMEVVGLDPGEGHHVTVPFPVWPRERFLAAADVVSLHVPLTEDTRGLVNAAWLAAMKPGSFLINTSRGGVVVEEDLAAALDRGPLAGAALDVFQTEPVNGAHPLARHPRVLATPHIGSATVETRRAMAMVAARNIKSALGGERPPNLLNAGAWRG